MVMLPVLYERGLLTAKQLGIVGATPALVLIATGLLLPLLYRRENPRLLLMVSVVTGVFVPVAFSIFVFGIGPLVFCVLAYLLNGFSVALSSIATNALQAEATSEGNRFSLFAQIGMMSDIVRIIVPLIIAFIFVSTDYRYVGLLNLILMAALLSIAVRLPKSKNIYIEPIKLISLKSDYNLLIKMIYEFLDSMASTQIFVFLPILMLAKGYSLQSSLAFQVALFAGYLIGRPAVAYIANKLNGPRALQVSEITMVVSMLALIVTNNSIALILIVTLLGMSARGTSPLIKAMVFDASAKYSKQNIGALHMAIGDGGNAIAQLSFGILLAAFGARAPFFASMAIVCLIVILSQIDIKRTTV